MTLLSTFFLTSINRHPSNFFIPRIVIILKDYFSTFPKPAFSLKRTTPDQITWVVKNSSIFFLRWKVLASPECACCAMFAPRTISTNFPDLEHDADVMFDLAAGMMHDCHTKRKGKINICVTRKLVNKLGCTRTAR
ncbi:hypothetical protein Zmor_009602 [Zophobas morio]|uniref:Uncharacterized protein n=1 Tax=Zophobas morio TaxID=2755281 RepID=A0AA38IH51_9CUCU|nr:hypothetical protein Zmor_009602 [Zophobas morio]